MIPHVCPWWLCFTFDNPLRRLFHDPERLLSPYVKPGMTVCDIGCGMGFFTIGLAQLVGSQGRVIAVDLQPRMLAALVGRAEKAGVADRIVSHLARPESLGVEEPVDFVLAFWMTHEVPDKERFIAEIFRMLKTGGRLFLYEPKLHVGRAAFDRTVETCRQAGLEVEARPSVALSRAVLLGKGRAAS